jgi:hypothetical protein
MSELPSRWGVSYVVRGGKMYDEYDGTYIGSVDGGCDVSVVDWKAKAKELGVDLKVCDRGVVKDIKLRDIDI